MKVLVTGADGFVGRHLCQALRAAGDEVIAAGGPRASQLPSVDITDEAAALRLIETAAPEAVIHLAGQSSVAQSHQRPGAAFSVNTLGTVNVLTAVKAAAPRARVLLIGSGEVYGSVPEGQRASEDLPLAPSSPYAASKVAAELAGLQFHRSYGLEVICARPFNHLGAGQDPSFVVPSFASQLQEQKRKGARPALKVGNLRPVRDFSHVLDVVAGYQLLLAKGAPGGIYNVCSGEGRSIQQLVERLFQLLGFEAAVEVDPARFRPADVPHLVGDPSRLEALGWKRTRTVDDALTDVLAQFADGPPPAR